MPNIKRIRISRLTLLIGLAAWLAIFTIMTLRSQCKGDITAIEDKLDAVKKVLEEGKLFDYKGAMRKLNEERVAPDDPRLVQLIRDYYILPPSTEPYSLHNPLVRDVSKDRISTKIDDLLQRKHDGFFIECGAFDGEFKSTSLFFERERDWSGLLVEDDPVSFARLRSKNRKAFMINACLSTTSYPAMMRFNSYGEVGRVIDEQGGSAYLQAMGNRRNEIPVQCFPLYSILLALNQLHVDFFTLDVEGAEFDVLQTVPLDKVNIASMLIEHVHIKEGLEPLQELLENNGYTVDVVQEDIVARKS